MRLAHLEKMAQDAHRWMSHDPDKMGTRYVEDFSRILEEDEAQLKELGLSDEKTAEYATKFEILFKCWIARLSNCSNWFMTGGANYNVRRNEKARNSEQKAYEIFKAWREKTIKRAGKAPRLTLDEKLHKKRSELVKLAQIHQMNKETNKLYKKGYTVEALMSIGHTQEDAEFLTHTWKRKISTGIAALKKCEEAIQMLEIKIEAREEQKAEGIADNQKVTINGGIAYLDFEIDRIVIKHDSKPSQEIISLMKKNSFKWSPKNGAWIRQITPNAKYALRQMLKQGL